MYIHMSVCRKKLPNRRRTYKKFVRKMLMTLTAGVDFTNVLPSAFIHADPKRAKDTDNLTNFFALLGSGCKKADRLILMKSAPGFGITDLV